tara:strand:- start:2199 stop:2975 length:777 start_codon:yes stop_codon:yes gene_type:complete
MIKAFLFDLDGVFYVDNQIIPGVDITIEWLKQNKIPYKFVTNNTTLPRKKLVEKMNKIGLLLKEDDLISANYAGTLLLNRLRIKSCKLVLQEIAKFDYQQFDTSNPKPEAIVIGDIGPNWNYNLMNDLMNLILEGAKLIALHKGTYFQSKKGLIIDSGAFVAGLEYSTQTNAIIVGKPQKTFFELATQNFKCKVDEIAMIGDDLINDIQGAKNMGYTSFLVKTGKFRSSIYKSSSIRPDHLIKSIAELPKYILSKSLI